MTALSSLTMQSFAQTSLSAMRSLLASSAVIIECDYETKVQNVNVTGHSQLLVQGSMYTMSGNGLQIYCDGKTLWVIDEPAREVVIESCSSHEMDYLSNPLLLMAEFDKFFKVRSSKRLGAGKEEYILDAIGDCGIDQAVLVLASDGKVVSGKFQLEDGNTLSIKVVTMKKTEEKQKSFFSPNQKFGSDWIVTDLR